MLVQKENEKRIEYLVRVLHHFMSETQAGSCVSDYDGTTCDGLCLANDIMDELDIYFED